MELTVGRLLNASFEEAGCWTATQERLVCPSDLAELRGVYAFVIEERVVYVGLASRSIKQRLGFYARPGKSQATNIRLNAKILALLNEGHTVRVFVAHPEDREWNGLRVSGPEGLEAALIEDFDLPWNKRGSTRPPPKNNTSNPGVSRREHGSTPQAIIDFVRRNPKCTEVEIADGVFGPGSPQQRANPYCRRLVAEGKLERLPTRPATYVSVRAG